MKTSYKIGIGIVAVVMCVILLVPVVSALSKSKNKILPVIQDTCLLDDNCDCIMDRDCNCVLDDRCEPVDPPLVPIRGDLIDTADLQANITGEAEIWVSPEGNEVCYIWTLENGEIFEECFEVEPENNPINDTLINGTSTPLPNKIK